MEKKQRSRASSNSSNAEIHIEVTDFKAEKLYKENQEKREWKEKDHVIPNKKQCTVCNHSQQYPHRDENVFQLKKENADATSSKNNVYVLRVLEPY